MTGVPAIVTFSRGWRLGRLAVTAGRGSSAGSPPAEREQAVVAAAIEDQVVVAGARDDRALAGAAALEDRAVVAGARDDRALARAAALEDRAVVAGAFQDRAAVAAAIDGRAIAGAAAVGDKQRAAITEPAVVGGEQRAVIAGPVAACSERDSLAAFDGAGIEVTSESGRRRRRVAAAGAAGVVGMLLVPLPAKAAPAPCEQAERYSAQSGSQVLRLTQLRLGSAGSDGSRRSSEHAGQDGKAPGSSDAASQQGGSTRGDASQHGNNAGGNSSGQGNSGSGQGDSGSGQGDSGPGRGDVQEVHVGEAKSAMVAQASVSSAAVARMIDAGGEGTPAELSEAVQQQAPPTNAEPVRRSTGAAEVGPVSLGDGKMTTHAQWEAGMACGATVGDVTRATARLRGAGLVADGGTALVRVPGKVESESTTKLERRGAAAATVATAGLRGGDLELLDGAVKVKVIKAPSLRASMSIADGGEVRYIPAVVEVSGRGFKTERLSTAGDDIEITFDEPRRRAATESASGAAPGGLLDKLPLVGGILNSGGALPLPEVPGLPEVTQPGSQPAPIAEPGTKVRISLGDVRQAARGRAIAARAAALSVTITHGSSDKRTKPGYGESAALAFDMGVLEAAAVAPETAGGVSAGGVAGETAGEAGGLPITGPRVDVIALSGVALLIAGAAALIFGMRGRSRS